MLIPRNYQKKAIELGVQFFKKENNKPSIMVCPTAYGKSILPAFISKELNSNILILQPSKELLEQNVDKYFLLTGKMPSIYSASQKKKQIGKITYATIGSIKNLGEEFKKNNFKYLIIDECHAYPRGEEGMLRKFLVNSDIKLILGLTATPFKLQTNSYNRENYSLNKMLTSKSKHGNLFKEINYIYQIEDIVKENYWANIKYDIINQDTSDLIFNSTKSDYTENSIQRFYLKNQINKNIISILFKYSDKKSILISVPSIEDCYNLQKDLKKVNIDSEVVHSNLNIKERSYLIDNFKSQKIRIIIQVGVLSIGFDHPLLDLLIMTRPTASLSFYYQLCGRVTRVHKDKKEGVIVDLCNNFQRFGDITKYKFVFNNNKWWLINENYDKLTDVPINTIGDISNKLYPLEKKDLAISEKIINFGKYKGTKLIEIPPSYRQFILDKFKKNKYNKELLEDLQYLQNKK